MPYKEFLFFCLTIPFLTASGSHAQISSISIIPELKYFVSLNYGYQMSGIKDEDFVSSNYTPLFNIAAGKWYLPYLAFQIGYKGFYFNYIGDDIKHHYNYFYGEAVVNISNVVHPARLNRSWNLLFHGGPGYFYNHVYGKPNICLNIGVKNSYRITDQFYADLDISSIIGWDIYQGDEDILPGVTIGVIYFFKSEK